MKTQQVLDICSGGGGFILGEAIALELGGTIKFETVAVCDNDPNCQDVLRLRFPDKPIIPGINDVTAQSLRLLGITQIDGICGGFPCQPHSVSGKKKGSQDERDLWPEFYRILRDIRPNWAIFENVPGLLTTDSGRFFRGILGDLAQLGFDAEWGVVPCAYMESGEGFVGVGGTHLRERVWIVAYSRPSVSGVEELADSGCQRQPPSKSQPALVRCDDQEACPEGAVAGRQEAPTHPNGIGCYNGGSVQREHEDLFHKKWCPSEDQQSGDKRFRGIESICSSDAGSRHPERLPQPLLCGSNDGVPPNLGGYLLRQDDLAEWLPASTIPGFSRSPRSSFELAPAEARALSQEDRQIYRKLKQSLDKEFDRAANSLEGESAVQYSCLKQEFSNQFREYQQMKKQINNQLSIFGNAVVPQVSAIAFRVLEERLLQMEGKCL